MDKSLKIVLTVFAIYFVLAIQFFFEKGIVIIPYEFNPLVLWFVSGLIAFKSRGFINFKVNLVYFIGLTIYCFTSERTLNIIYNQTDIKLFIEFIQNPFTRLISIIGLLISVLFVVFSYQKQRFGNYILFVAMASATFGLLNFELIYVLLFSVFTLFFVIVVNFSKSKDVIDKFSSAAYQLLLFSLLEGLFFLVL